MKKFDKKKLRSLLLIIAILSVVAPFYLILGCPIRFFTGISCMGCGMSRALEALLHLDFAGAFHYHPLIYIMPVCFLIFIFREKIPPKIMKILFAIGIALMFIVYFIRLFSGSDIVYFKPETGFIYKVIEAFKEFLKYIASRC